MQIVMILPNTLMYKEQDLFVHTKNEQNLHINYMIAWA